MCLGGLCVLVTYIGEAIGQSFSTVGDSDLQGAMGLKRAIGGAFEEKWAIRGRFEKRSNKNKLRICNLFVKKICLNIQNIFEVNQQKLG